MTNRTDALSVLIWVLTVCKDYQRMTNVAASKEMPGKNKKTINMSSKDSDQPVYCSVGSVLAPKRGQSEGFYMTHDRVSLLVITLAHMSKLNPVHYDGFSLPH